MQKKKIDPEILWEEMEKMELQHFIVNSIIDGEKEHRRMVYVVSETDNIIAFEFMLGYDYTKFIRADRLFGKDPHDLLDEFTYKMIMPSGSERITSIINHLDTKPENVLMLDDDEEFDELDSMIADVKKGIPFNEIPIKNINNKS